ncbi:MAG: zinc-ribbon domain-containing protein [Acutalibacteraceae bacterium]
MAKIFCSKCGTQIDDAATFCFKCGNKVYSDNTTKPTEEQTIERPVKKVKHNPFIKYIFITIAVQILLVIISARPGNIGGYAFLLALVLIFAVLAFSIISIVKAKNYNKKGKATGIVFTVLSAILVIVISAATINGITNNNIADNEYEYIDDCVHTVAINSVGNLKNMLKDPSSLKINKIYAKVYDTRITAQFSDGTYYDGGDFKGYFEIYIDYTATNGFGGVGRECYYFKWSQDLVCTNSKQIDSMPDANNDVWVLDVEKYNELAQNMVLY